MTTPMTQPVLRTTLGTPRQETVGPQRTTSRQVLIAGAGAGAGLGVAIASATGWLYWRRRQQKRRRLDWRVRRSTGGFLTDLRKGKPGPLTTSASAAVLLLATLARIRPVAGRGEREREPARSRVMHAAADADRVQAADGASRAARIPVWLLLPLVGVSACVVWWRARSSDRPRYIGTPGVESALGRDLTRTGELPPDMGFEHPYQ